MCCRNRYRHRGLPQVLRQTHQGAWGAGALYAGGHRGIGPRGRTGVSNKLLLAAFQPVQVRLQVQDGPLD
jgi:hypothetical protein